MAILINKQTNEVILERVTVAKSPLSRLKGLMGQKTLPVNTGLMLTPCNSIHCFFMRFAIDAAFVDKEGKVLKIITNMRPGMISPIVRRSSYVVESNPFVLGKKLREGDTVKLLELY